MAICPCNEEVEIEVNQLDAEEGDILSCPECGVALSVIGVAPVELELIDEEDEDDDDDDDEDDEDDDDDDEDDDDEEWDDDDEAVVEDDD